MHSLITKGIRVTVQTYYDHEVSKPSLGRFIHAYQIKIENLSDRTVKLLSRHWKIYASDGVMREVKGDGVVGKQPVLQMLDVHEYTSWSPLPTPVGKMLGSFTMLDMESNESFEVEVPEFKLIADYINN